MADQFGLSVIAAEDIPADESVVSAPFSLAVTHEVAKNALEDISRAYNSHLASDNLKRALAGLSERQIICIYICLHWNEELRAQTTILGHQSYLDTLPEPSQLTTPLHFTEDELAAFKGTNLYGATLDRERQWKTEWVGCKEVVSLLNPKWTDEFTWTRYLTASTYLSSRAFPSTLLSPNPTLQSSPSSYPVLLPGIDALNHARGAPVSWVIKSRSAQSQVNAAPDTGSSDLSISLVLHSATPKGHELFNNYGPKPNSELILGYGFSLPSNPDDTIVLKIAGSGFSTPADGGAPASSGELGKWEVGRGGRGADAVWKQVLSIVSRVRPDETGSAATSETGRGDDARSYEDELEAAEILHDMVQSLIDRLPGQVPTGTQLRPAVEKMLHHYLEGTHFTPP
ncbi:SET domain-containing protein [Punctularia strigosozonata HHB-11173 SS5]|uniref:SET domain-containing protein n=1 Tax=Punctularia strigosozonata (strain HHB-11173) TaxID=741275 RepID=UPI0004417F04|nr:SET domain-containing protein [Punctularia strigosozonata HHB-11173 SS5]EIN05838.1 SET domain-containing protein [Punctularia strigosozonata HHB-11173 SS5]